MKRFEYKVLNPDTEGGFWGTFIKSETLESELNKLGFEGWEVISHVQTTLTGHYPSIMILLKREI